jgi:hypothetical protein
MKKNAFLTNRINFNELIFDFAILFFPLMLEEIYDPLMASAPFGLPFVQLFITGTIYFLPLLIGRMYNVDFKDASAFIRKLIPVILFLTTFFAYGNLLYLVIPTFNDAESHSRMIFMTATLFLIMGPTAGLMFTRKDAPRIEGASTQLFLFLFTIAIIPLLYVLISGESIFGNTAVLAGILIAFGLMMGDALLIVLLYFIYIKTKAVLVRLGIYKTFIFVVKLMTPFCVSFMLVFFNINSSRLLVGIELHGAASVLLVILIFVAGVLPLRIMLMMTPPVRPINIVLGILSAASMILVVSMN